MKTRLFHSRQPGPTDPATPENTVTFPEKNASAAGSATTGRTRRTVPPDARRKTGSGLPENRRRSLQTARFFLARHRPDRLSDPVRPAPGRYPSRARPAGRFAIRPDRDEFATPERRAPASRVFNFREAPSREKTGDLPA